MSDYEPKLVCFTCDFSWGYLSEKDTLNSRIDHWVPIVCSGRIDATYVLDAFNAGADGVLILGCPEGDCHFQDGNFEARKKVYLLQKLLEDYGIERGRLRIELSQDPAGDRIPKLIEEMKDSIRRLGPVKKLQPLWLRSKSLAE